MDYSAIEHFSNEQLTSVMDFLKEPVIGLSLNYQVNFANDTMTKVLGRAFSDLIGTDFQKFCKQHQRSLALFSNIQSILDGNVFEEQITYKNSSTPSQNFEIHAFRQLNKNKPVGFILHFKPITESNDKSKERLQSLKNMAQKVTGHRIEDKKTSEDYAKIMVDYYENIIAVMPGNVYWMNADGVHLGCNDNNAVHAGLQSRKDIVGKTLYDFFEEHDAENINQINKKIMGSNTPQCLEEAEPPEVGAKRKVYLTQKVPLHDPDGNVIGLLGVSFDITDRKKMEEDLKKAKEAAEAANKVKSQFIANMQHDLRTPCSGLYGMMRLYADKEKSPEKKRDFKALSHSAKELLNILDNIADVNRLESGFYPILEKKFNIHELLERVIRVEEPMAMYKMLQLSAHVDSDVPDVLRGDEFRLHRILLNLVSNAVKFTDKGYIRIWVKVAQMKKRRKIILKFIVEDTGMGIPEKEQQRVYEKFVRLTDANRGLYKGSGLGLTIVKRFVDELDGEIDIESSSEEGTKFIILLPLKVSLLGDEAILEKEDTRV